MRKIMFVSIVGTMLVMLACPASGAIGDSAYGLDMLLNTYQPIMYDGQSAWEYVYDVYVSHDGANRESEIWNMYLVDFDPTGLLNLWTAAQSGNGKMHDYWTGWHAGQKPWWWPGTYNYSDYAPSYGVDNAWEINPSPTDISDKRWSYDANFAATHGMANLWHSPDDYGMPAAWQGGEVKTIAGGASYDGLEFFYIPYGPATGTELEGLLVATIRLVHVDGPAGMVNLRYDSGYMPNRDAGYAIGPDPSYVESPPGDYDGDGDVDADDVDILCDNLGDAAYDLDGDGDADEDDMIYLIVNLVELQDGSGRVGTVRGDFNLDGFVDGTDLALMKVAFGQPNQDYADGNANCDALVDGTDLAILKVNMGFIAPTGGGVPEPATIGLLAFGGLAMIRRRRS